MRRRRRVHQEELEDSAKTSLFWCTPSLRVAGAALAEEVEAVAEGATLAVLLTDGRVLVGDVVRCARSAIVLRLLGHAPEQNTRIPHRQIRALRVVGEHTWASERFVADRQRRGLPALTLAGVNPG